MIDLRSDTVSKPTEAMRRAMAEAEVGDDVYRDDPTVRALEDRTAAILGKEDACYMPTGTMTNQTAIRAHTEPGDVVLADVQGHVAVLEKGAPAALSGVTMRALPGDHGIFSGEDVAAACAPPHKFSPQGVQPPLKLLCVENTHNLGGGTVWPPAALIEVAAVARRHGLALHLDGARLWNAAVASGLDEAELARPFDSVSVCFSKGLGAPMGSALAGSADIVARARRFKALFGGGFRQAGIVAAGALYALEHHRQRLAEDHANARRFAEALDLQAGIAIDLETVETNIVRFRVIAMPAADFVERCFEAGLSMLTSGADGVRAVFHLGVDAPDTDRAINIVREVILAELTARLDAEAPLV